MCSQKRRWVIWVEVPTILTSLGLPEAVLAAAARQRRRVLQRSQPLAQLFDGFPLFRYRVLQREAFQFDLAPFLRVCRKKIDQRVYVCWDVLSVGKIDRTSKQSVYQESQEIVWIRLHNIYFYASHRSRITMFESSTCNNTAIFRKDKKCSIVFRLLPPSGTHQQAIGTRLILQCQDR